jgi:hypothetical protein
MCRLGPANVSATGRRATLCVRRLVGMRLLDPAVRMLACAAARVDALVRMRGPVRLAWQRGGPGA